MTEHQPAGPDHRDGQRVRVAVVFGGRSSEHAVSCATAAGVLRAIDRDRYDVVPVGIAPDGRWVLAADDPEPLELTADQTPAVRVDGTELMLPTSTRERGLTVRNASDVPEALHEVDVVFPLLHGPYGEDGTLQGILELADVRYVGSGVLASAAGMDKHYMKVILAGAGLPVGPYRVITDAAWRHDRERVLDLVRGLEFPLFVKPCRAGSSVGISKVTAEAELVPAIEKARSHDLKVIVESGIDGREIECGVLQGRDGEPTRTSEVGEIVVDPGHGHDFYDFEAKYLDETGAVHLSCPADVATEVSDTVRRYAAAAFDALGCEGLARVDCFVADDGEVLVNEINTMPGFTPHSMYPRMWAATGVGYPELIDELVQLALSRPLGLR
jgi:D-alanine-D-alanine ligase